MVNKKLSRIFKNPIRLEVTWDGDVVDMLQLVMDQFKNTNNL